MCGRNAHKGLVESVASEKQLGLLEREFNVSFYEALHESVLFYSRGSTCRCAQGGGNFLRYNSGIRVLQVHIGDARPDIGKTDLASAGKLDRTIDVSGDRQLLWQ